MIPYFLVPLIGSIGLTAAYGLVTATPVWTKVLAAALLAVSFYWRNGLFLQVGLSVCLLL